MMVPEYLGQMLITGEEMHAASAADLYFRWRPGGTAFFMRVHHPLPNTDVEASPEADLGGYPLLSCPAGVLVGDDTTFRFLTTINGFPSTGWHRDVSWSLGIPAHDSGMLFMGAGGMGATQGLIALDAATGIPRWGYAPGGLAGDPTQIVERRVRKTVTWTTSASVDQAMTQALQAMAKTRERPLTGSNEPVRSSGGRTQFARSNSNPNDAFRGIVYGPNGLPADLEKHFQTLFGSAPGPISKLPHGHWSNPGAITLNGAVYAEVAGTVVSLSQSDGTPYWKYPLGPGTFTTSMVASPDHLFCCLSRPRSGRRDPVWSGYMANGESRLIALDLKTGKKVWDLRLQKPGVLSLSGGILYLSDGDLHAFGPAERTFHVAVDSERAADYRQHEEHEDEARANGEAIAPHPSKPDTEGLADATLLRLNTDLDNAELMRRVRARQEVAGSAPVSLSLDWLDETRANRRHGGGNRPWTAAEIREFAQLSGTLAAQVHPAHFDVAPEVNAYLLRNPDQIDSVLTLVRDAAAAIHGASPSTKVLVSLNVELLNGRYGHAEYLPLGKVQSADRVDRGHLLDLVPLVDEVGLTTYPQAALARRQVLPPDYLLSAQALFGEKPVVVTRIAVRVDPRQGQDAAQQSALVRQMLQECYWLNAPLVAYPDVLADTPQTPRAEVALRVADQARPALTALQDTWRFKRVEKLSLGSPKLEPEGTRMAALPHSLR